MAAEKAQRHLCQQRAEEERERALRARVGLAAGGRRAQARQRAAAPLAGRQQLQQLGERAQRCSAHARLLVTRQLPGE